LQEFLFFGFLAGFLGSIQPGPVNTNVVLNTVARQYKTASMIAMSGSFIQGLGAFLSFLIHSKMASFVPNIEPKYIGLTFFILSFYYFFAKNNPSRNKEKSSQSGFGQGLFLAILNPQILPFWIFVLSILPKISYNLMNAILFGLSAFLGTYSILYLMMVLVKKYNFGLDKIEPRYLLSATFMVLGIINVASL
jgi:threonine/homoserine/homoserine lactone efflux protein